MYAIIQHSGRQFRVEEGQQVDLDFGKHLDPGAEVKFERVLIVNGNEGTKVGSPTVDGAEVSAEVIGPRLGKKLVVQKFRRRKNSRRKTGHRQLYTRVKINKIEV